MRRIRNLTGMPVIYRGEKLGRLAQADLSQDLKRLEGIWVDCGLRGTRYLPSEQLELIGQAAIIADDRGKRRRCNGQALLRRAVSTDGSRIGAVVDAQIDEISFLVQALELSRGIWDDLYGGRLCVERFEVKGDGEVVIVADSMHSNLKEEAE